MKGNREKTLSALPEVSGDHLSEQGLALESPELFQLSEIRLTLNR